MVVPIHRDQRPEVIVPHGCWQVEKSLGQVGGVLSLGAPRLSVGIPREDSGGVNPLPTPTSKAAFISRFELALKLVLPIRAPIAGASGFTLPTRRNAVPTRRRGVPTRRKGAICRLPKRKGRFHPSEPHFHPWQRGFRGWRRLRRGRRRRY